MQKNLHKKTIFSTFLILGMFLFPGLAHAADPLSGPAFSDPSKIQKMPPEWEKQPIRYEAEAGKVDVAIALDQNLYPLYIDKIRAFAAKEKLKIAVNEGTCGTTGGKLARKSVDIGAFCCPPGETDRLPGLRFHTVGLIPVALIVHPDNPIDDMTLGQARALFQGKIYNWSELKDSHGRPGPDLKTHPIGRLHCKLRPGHWRLLLENEDLFSPSLAEVGAIPDMISLVGKTPGAIGWEALLMVEKYADKGRVKPVSLNGLAPSASNLVKGRYPLYRTLVITTWEGKGLENENARKLVRFIIKEAEGLEGKYGFVPASTLKKNGWKFKGDELIGAP